MEGKILDKYDLYWSKYFEMDSDFNPIKFNDYLYMPERFSDCFWILFERLHHTHDYCLNVIISSEVKLHKLRLLAEQCPYSEESYYWEHNIDVIARASVLIVMCSFTEWGLKRVISELGEDLRLMKPKGSNIDQLINIIKTKYFNNLIISTETLSILQLFRRARNKFAHGDWAGLDEELNLISLKEVFSSVSEIFEVLESCYWDKFYRNM